MNEPAVPASSVTGGRQLRIHGYEVVVHTARVASARYLTFVFLTDPFDEARELKIFKGRGATADEAEEATLREALLYLDRPAGVTFSSILPGRSTLHIQGRKVDIFCDTIGEGRFQAFPFLYRDDGTRVLILRFHLREAVTGHTPADAIAQCIRRVEDYFRRGESRQDDRDDS